MGLRSQQPSRRWLFVALIVALLAGGTAVALALRSSGPSPAKETSPTKAIAVRHSQAVVRSIDAATRAQTSAQWTSAGYDHYEVTGSKWRSTSDVTANSGVQRITITRLRVHPKDRKGPNGFRPTGTAKAEIRLVGDAFYVSGNVTALEWMALHMTHAQALRYAGRWISVPKRHDPLTGLASEELTLTQIVDYIDPAADFGTGFLAWREVPAPQGTQILQFLDSDETMDPITLTTLTGGKPLPVADEGSGVTSGECRGGESCPYAFSNHFSRWNEPVHVTAPKHAVPLATVRRS